MPRAFVLCFTIVAAFPAWIDAAPPISEEATVPPAVSAVARMLGLDPPRDRARFVAEFARLLYASGTGRSDALAALVDPRLLDPELVAAERPMRVPVPLTAEVWGRSVFRRAVRSDDLVGAILTDRRAALLSYGLAGLDDETLDYVAREGALLADLHERSAPAFAAFGASLRIRGGRVAPPGGDRFVPLWEAGVRQSVANPDAFVRALFSMSEARLAYLYDTIAELPPSNAAFVLGAWMSDPVARGTRFASLLEACSKWYREWRPQTMPFSRPLHDLSLVFLRLRVDHTGALAAPASRAFWEAAFASDDLDVGGAAPAELAAGPPVDAAWLAETTAASDVFSRGDRADQFAFAQRVFSGAPSSSLADVLVAVRAFPNQRMLLLTLERMGVTAPAVYASIARRAARLSDGSPDRQFRTLGQAQAAVALVARMTSSGTLSRETGERLIASVFGVPLDGDRYRGAMAAWLRHELLPLLPAAPATVDLRDVGAVELRVIAALAGPDPGTSAPRVYWEGQTYRLDMAAGERRRLVSIRQKQEGYSVDLALALEGIGRALAAEGLTTDAVRSLAAELAALPDRFDRRLDSPAESRAPGVEEVRQARAAIDRFGEGLARSVREGDARRAARLAPAVGDLVDDVLADGLMSLAYAADLGEPDGAPMLARNVALRHDFGFGRKDAAARLRSAWAIPRQDFLPGVPWHVTGSLLGLDIAMAPLSLKRISPDRLAAAPRLPSNEREAFAVGVALMNPRRLLDADRDRIVAAIGRGRERVAALAARRTPLDDVADALGMDGWRRRAIGWMLAEDPASISSMFSLVEFLALGGGFEGASLDGWGTSGLQSEGCACTRLTLPRRWRLLSGRTQMALMASGVADLNLRATVAVAHLGVPAALARYALAAATLEFVENVAPADPNDWWTLARTAQAVPDERIEDYVAAAAAVDGPLVPEETVADRHP